MNTTVITGNLVRDPELRSTASGSSVANFSVADNRRWADPATGERREATTFVDVVAWGDLGRHVAESLRQGDRVTVSGRLEQRSWQTDQGERRSKLELTAADVAASLRWAAVGILKAEHGVELSQDQDFGYDLAEEGAAEAVHPEPRQAPAGRPLVQGRAVAGGPVAEAPQQPVSAQRRLGAAQATGDFGR